MLASAEGTKSGSQADELDRFAAVLAAAVLLLLPVARGWVLWTAPGGEGDINQWVSTSPLDWPLALLVVVQAASSARGGWLRGARRWPAPVILLVVTLGWATLCALVNPSWRAVDLGFHVAGAWALVRTARRATPVEQTVLLAVVSFVGVFQALLGIGQSRNGDVLGIGLLEFDGPLYTFGDSAAGRGSLTHPYHLTVFLMTAATAAALLWTRLAPSRRWSALAAVAVIGVAIPLTFSRAAVLALGPMVLLWAWPKTRRALAGALLAGLLVGALLGADGVTAKTDQSVDVASADSGRRDRYAEAWRLTESEPVFGVGPGRYVTALRDVAHDDLLPAHNIVAQAGAETGIPGALLMAATVLAYLAWLLRRSAMVVAIGLALVPFHLLDSYPHVFPVGLVITGTWLAVLAIAVEDEEPADDIR